MINLVQTGTVLMANIYTIWLLRWGYEIVTLAHLKHDPRPSSSSSSKSTNSSYIDGLSLNIWESLAILRAKLVASAKSRPRARSNRKSQVRVMSIMEPGGAQHTEEDDSNIVLH